MFIIGLGLATPPRRYHQQECWDALRSAKPYARLSTRSRAILKRVLQADNGIATRHLALDPLAEAFDLTPDALHGRFSRHAPALASRAAVEALRDAGTNPEEVDGLVVSTCTGYLCPGLSSYVSERLGLRADVMTLDLVGQGCGAAMPNLRAAEALLSARRCERVLSVCVEVCSAAFYLDDDPGVLISACLFGDGAAAAVLAGTPKPGGRRIRWKTAGSILSPEDRDYLRFDQRQGMLRNILSRQVPALAAKHAERVFLDVTRKAGARRDEIAVWIMHAGGRNVLLKIQERFGLAPDQLRLSAEVLRDYGNLSSPFVLFVLRAARAGNRPGGLWWMSSFGAGFSCHGALLEVD
jgi:predicted naringenin-chalcone synthase